MAMPAPRAEAAAAKALPAVQCTTAIDGIDMDVPRIAIMSAFGPEIALLLENVDDAVQVTMNGRTVTIGTLRGAPVVLTMSGISMVNAAMATEALLRSFNVSRLLFSGIAGAVDESMRIGDVVVPARFAEYQESYFARAAGADRGEAKFDEPYPASMPGVYDPAFGIGRGIHFGMMWPQAVRLASCQAPDDEVNTVWMMADQRMLDVAKAMPLQCSKASGDQARIYVGGNCVSGPSFMDNAEYRQYVWDTWRPDAVDMESAAVAHVAAVHGTPLLVFRSLSDLAGGNSDPNEINKFMECAAFNAATVLLNFLDAWRSDL